MRFLFVDRILQLTPGQGTHGIKHITLDEPYLCQDEQGKLCFIPSLIGEALGQLAAWNVMLSNDFTFRPVAGIVSRACLKRPTYVGETLLLESTIDSLDEAAVRYHGVARVGDEEVFRIESAIGPLLPMHQFIETQTVRSQFSAIDRAGHWPTEVPTYETPVSSHTIPAALPFMAFDRIISIEPGVRLCAEKRINGNAPYFPDHFPNNPVLPMTVLLECKLNLAKEFIAQSSWAYQYHVSELRKIKMNDFVHPGDALICYLEVKRQKDRELILSYRSEVDGRRVCVLDVVLTAKDE